MRDRDFVRLLPKGGMLQARKESWGVWANAQMDAPNALARPQLLKAHWPARSLEEATIGLGST